MVAPPQLTAIAKSIHCANLRAVKPSKFASAEGRCIWNGSPAEVATFANDQLRDRSEKMEKTLGEKAFTTLASTGPVGQCLFPVAEQLIAGISGDDRRLVDLVGSFRASDGLMLGDVSRISDQSRQRSWRRELVVECFDVNSRHHRGQLATTRTGQQISFAGILVRQPSY